MILTIFIFVHGLVECHGLAHEDSKRLFDDLLRFYNKIQRPFIRGQETVPMLIKLRLSLSQIIDVHEKDQIMTTSVWVEQEWYDPKLAWNSSEYGGVKVLYVPAEMIWVPDINFSADSYYNITIVTKASVFSSGTVIWKPPAIYKSLCPIDVEWFPFDEQNCHLKFGSWTYDSRLLDLQHKDKNRSVDIVEPDDRGIESNVSVIWQGVDICDYYPSVEWEIIRIPAKRHNVYYAACCPGMKSFADITYYITLRRKPLFYTVNLIFPCVGISFLTILVFYLPSDSGEKITLCISILVALTVFFLLLTEIIPATSIVLPLFGKYLLFTMLMVTISVIITVMTINIHFRSPATHTMPKWIKTVFLKILPRYLFMKRPIAFEDESFRRVSSKTYAPEIAPTFNRRQAAVNLAGRRSRTPSPQSHRQQQQQQQQQHQRPRVKPRKSGLSGELIKNIQAVYRTPQIMRGFENVCFIADLMKNQDRDDKIDEDWKYVAMVLDRLFLWIFSAACFFGTIVILLQAPTFYDDQEPLTRDSCIRKDI